MSAPTSSTAVVAYDSVGSKRKKQTGFAPNKRQALSMYLRPRDAMQMDAKYGALSSGHQRGYSGSRQRSKWATISSRSDPVYPQPEVKNVDSIIGSLDAPAPVPTTGVPAEFTTIPQGVTATTRVGRKLAIKSIYYQFTVQFNPSGQEPLVFRHILFWDRQPNGAAMTGAIIDALLSTQPYVVSPMNLNNSQRFVILADDRVTLSPQGDQIKIINGFRKINQFSLYSNSVDVPQSGALRALFFSDVDDNPPVFYGNWRLRMIDD